MLYRWDNPHNGYELERVFGIKEKCASFNLFHKYSYVLLKRLKSKQVLVDYLDYLPQALQQKFTYYDGFWQWERYFHDCQNEVKNAFTFKVIDNQNMELGAQMKCENSISIHFRRGDYLNLPRLMVCDDDYYNSAISYMLEHVENPMFYVFSNDTKWSDDFMKKLQVPYRIIDFNQGQNSYRDMYLMTQCKHNIIANSSFSWWGAYLNSCSQKIVVSPKEWNRRVPSFHPQLDGWVKF